MYPNGDIFFGQHKVYVKEGCGKMVYLDGSVYEGTWESDRRMGHGRHVDAVTGNIYVGDYIDGKK